MHQGGNILDLLIDDDCPRIVDNIRVVDDLGLSDHFLVMPDRCPDFDDLSHSCTATAVLFRNFCAVDVEDFATQPLSYVYMSQSDNVDEFYRQIELSVTSVYSTHWHHSETKPSDVASAAVCGCLKRLLLPSGHVDNSTSSLDWRTCPLAVAISRQN